MAKYAERTEVPVDRRILEIQRTLERYGVTAFGFARDGDASQVVFEMGGRRMRITVRLPDRAEKRFVRDQHGYQRDAKSAERAYQQAVRQRWAALSLYIKAVCEAIDSDVITAENAFLPFVVLPDGRTLSEYVAPQLAAVYESGEMPALLPGGGRG
jgi:hypothetical protein